MHRIDGAGHVNHLFVAEDPATSRPPTEITPEIMNAFQEELATFIEWAGIVLAKGDNTQLKQALVTKFAGLDVAATKAGVQGQSYTAFTTGGATGAFTLTPAPAITGYAAGQRFRVKFHAAGNGSDTLNVSGLGEKSLKQYDSTGAKVAAVIAANQLVDVEYDGADMLLLDPLTLVQAGEVAFFARNTAPAGYLKANGAAVSRAAYATLFGAIGTTFGAGDGATTFNIPDIRGEFLRGWDDSRGVDSGRSLGSFQQGTHITGDNSVGPAVHGIGNLIGQCNVDPADGTARDIYYTPSATILSDATNFWGRVRPRNVALLACIRY